MSYCDRMMRKSYQQGREMTAISKAVNDLGGQTKVGRILGVQQTAVWNWVNRHRQAPAKYIRKISALTNNEITVEQLLADHENNHENNQAKG